jgi:hypothetical protein
MTPSLIRLSTYTMILLFTLDRCNTHRITPSQNLTVITPYLPAVVVAVSQHQAVVSQYQAAVAVAAAAKPVQPRVQVATNHQHHLRPPRKVQLLVLLLLSIFQVLPY